MALVAGTVITEVKGLLNDPTGSIYPDQALFPLLNKAYREIQAKLSALGISVTKEVDVTVSVPSGTISLSDGGGLPNDLIHPVYLAERLAGTLDSFTEMVEDEWDRDVKPSDTLRYWVWREEVIHLRGATTDRNVLIRFIKSLPPVSDANSPIVINDVQTFLAQRTAALAALLIGHNQSRSDAMMGDLYSSQGPWDDIKAMKVKRMQNIPVRRRRTRWRVK
jgi:hypothetical protein